MLCCGCKKPPHVVGARTQLLDPSISNNFLYQQQHATALYQSQQAAALAAAAGQMGGGALTPQPPPGAATIITAPGVPAGTIITATPAPTPGVLGHLPGNQRFVGNINYVMQQQHPMYHTQTVPGPGGRGGGGYLAASSTGIFTKQPGGQLYSSMIFPQQQGQGQVASGGILQDGRQSRIVPDSIGLQPDSFRRVSGIATEVFRQIEAVEAEFDPSQLAAQYAEMERRGEMIIRILNPAQLQPAWLEDTCRRYGDGIRLPSWVQFVEVIKRPGQTLGLYIREGDFTYTRDGVYISRIALESPVYQSGCLRVGDEILAINMVDVQRMSLDDVVIIMSIPRRLILTIRSRPLNATVDHLLPGANRLYGSESYYDTVASDIYSRVDDLRATKPVVVLKQQLEDEEAEAAAEEAEAEAEAAAAAVAAALDAATVAAEVGLLDAAEIAAASAEQLQASAIRARSNSLQRLDGGYDRPASRIASRRKLFSGTADNLAELAMADAAYVYAATRRGRTGSLSGYDRPSSRLSVGGGGRAAAALMAKKQQQGQAAAALYSGRLASRSRSATGRLLRTSSDLYLAQGPDELMDRALIQSAIVGSSGRRHSLADTDAGDLLLSRYSKLRGGSARNRPQSLDRGYKSALRPSLSNQTLTGGAGAAGSFAQRRLESILAARRGFDAYSDTEAYDTPTSLMAARRAMTPSGLGRDYASRSSSLPRGGPRNARTAALNERLAQLEQFYVATAAAARRHTLTGHGGGGGPGSRPHSALAGAYSDREELERGFDGQLGQRERAMGHRSTSSRPNILPPLPSLASRSAQLQAGSVASADAKLSRVPSTSAIYETIRKREKLAAELEARERFEEQRTTSSLPRHRPAYGDERTKEINEELNARFASRHLTDRPTGPSSHLTKDDHDYELLARQSTAPAKDPTGGPRPLMIDPSGFQQYGPELRAAATAHGRSEEQAGYSGLLVIHLLGVRGLQVDGGASGAMGPSTGTGPIERNLYCVVECDRVYKARTVAVQSHDSNTTHFDWDEIFDIDLFDTKEVTFLFYTWNPTSRHKLCSKGTVHLPWINSLRNQHVHAFEMRLYETPGAMLYIKLEFHDLRTTFKRTKRDPAKTGRRGSRGTGGLGSSAFSQEHPLFGVDLDSVLARENSGFSVPIIVKRCTEEIEARGLHLVGIYRLCGSAIRKKNLRENFERNSWLADLSADSVPDINVITSLLKDYLRELPEPLFNKALFDMMDDGLSVCLPDDPTGNAKLMFSILECLSKSGRNTVLFLMDHIKLIHLNADRNKMTSQALAICFGPLFSCHADSESVHKAIQVFKFLLDIWPQRRGSFNFMRKLDDAKGSSTKDHHRDLTPPVTMVKSSGPIAPGPLTTTAPHSTGILSSSTAALARDYTSARDPPRGELSTESSRISATTDRTTTVSLTGGKAGPIQISERNPFRGLIGSMNAAAAERAEAEYAYPKSSSSLYHDSPPGSRYTGMSASAGRSTTTTTGPAAVTSSISWISSSSGSSSGGRMLPSTQSATRTISTYSSASNVVSQIKVPPGSTGPSPRVTEGSSWNTATTTSTTSGYSRYSGTTASADYNPTSSTYHHNYPSGTSSLEKTSLGHLDSAATSTSSYHRMNHVTSYDPPLTTTTSSYSSTTSSRPYYSSYLNSTTTSSTTGYGSVSSSVPGEARSLSPSSRRTTTSVTSSYMTSSTGEPVYSTVNKPSRTTDLYASGSTSGSGYSSSYTRRGHLDDLDDDLGGDRYRSYGGSAAIAPTTTSTSSSWSTSDATSGLGASRYSRYTDSLDHSTSATSAAAPRSYLTSPPSGSAATATSSDPLIKPLIGSGSGSSIYPSKFGNNSATGSYTGGDSNGISGGSGTGGGYRSYI